MVIESGSYFWVVLAALIPVGYGFFRLACPAINRLTKWIVNRKWRKT